LDSLFSDAEDLQEDVEIEFDLIQFESKLADTSARDEMILTDNGAWNFIILRAGEDKASEMIKSLNNKISASSSGVRVLSWRQAAGNTALAVFAVQTIFNIGMIFLAFGAIMVIMNSLVISVLERTSEIGTMRSLGAPVRFIKKLFIVESIILTMTAAVFGIIIGMITVFLIGKSGISINNSLLISLFGGKVIQTTISLKGVLMHLGLSLIVGAFAWIYPVHLAIRVQPLSAMNSE